MMCTCPASFKDGGLSLQQGRRLRINITKYIPFHEEINIVMIQKGGCGRSQQRDLTTSEPAIKGMRITLLTIGGNLDLYKIIMST